MNAYLVLAIFALLLLAIVFLGLRFVGGALRQRRDAEATLRRTGPASDYYARTLRQAAEVVGGEDKLAAALKVPPEALRRWLEREESPPVEVHLAALDLVTRESPETRAE